MVSWNNAFRTASKIVAYSLIFWLVGASLIIVGYFYFIMNSLYRNSLDILTIVPSLVSIILGFIILVMGGLATFLKFNTELIVDETRKIGINGIGRNENRATETPVYSANDVQERKQVQVNKEANSKMTRNILEGIIYIVIGSVITAVGYYINSMSNIKINFYFLLGDWILMLIGIILIVYGIYSIIIKYIHR